MSRLLIAESPLVLLPSLAVALQSAEKAIICQQLHYLLNTSEIHHEERKWVTLTIEKSGQCKSWQEIIPWMSARNIKRLLEELRQIGVIKSANLNKTRLDRTLSWTVDGDAIDRLILDSASGQNVTIARPDTNSEETAQESQNSESDKMALSKVTKCPDINTKNNNKEDIFISSNTSIVQKNLNDRMTEEDFIEFWDKYPRKQNRKKAAMIFSKIKRSLLEQIIGSIEEFSKMEQWKKGFIPLPTTFLNGERWNDLPFNPKTNGQQHVSSTGSSDIEIFV